MNQKNISVQKTARYFVLGEPSEQIKEVWFVLHGYGQLANYFLKKFEVLNNGFNLIVAPEALHRFYWQGFSGRVGASWMTKEDRLEEIKDYINYLNEVYDEVIAPFKRQKIKINVLGFSQGTATVCRWVTDKKAKVDNLILWAGIFPHDLNLEQEKTLLNDINSTIVMGDQDEFLTIDSVKKHIKELHEKGVNVQLTPFNGKHEIPSNELLLLAESL